MSNETKRIDIEYNELLNYAHKFKDEGYRLVQICCTKTADGLELNYSFAFEYDLVNLKILIDPEAEIHSISSIFEPAFLYENEMHDLFGVTITGISLDYKGELYKLSTKTPYACPAEAKTKE